MKITTGRAHHSRSRHESHHETPDDRQQAIRPHLPQPRDMPSVPQQPDARDAEAAGRGEGQAMTTPAMRSAEEWADEMTRFDGASRMHRALLAAQVQSDAIAFTEARVAALVRAQVVEECAKVCREYLAQLKANAALGKYSADVEDHIVLVLSIIEERIRALAAKPVEKQE